ncbi:hypothetical protein [Roseivirga sp. E12]|uniref:hypothetical protein n=1 Tax=Roseivirga sp. E12 TaxID=2819237 RepID=UPI001ABCEF94|nr:hypothetical protein [Roseivirga sp. E12]MBO3698048.1 hypothetical protein [Roseivirga sp. E12]
MKRFIALCVIVCSLVTAGCCKKCDLPFEESELNNLKYQMSSGRTFSNGAGNEVTMSFQGTDVEDSGKTCGGFGSPDLNACSTNATQRFDVSGGISDLTVELNKFRDDTSTSDLQMVISMGDANIFIFFDGGAMSPSTSDRTSSMTINGTTYDDVLTYFFDPNNDCKQPSGPNCVDDNDIVGVDFSLTAGLLRFQIHKGLQTPNEVYTVVN